MGSMDNASCHHDRVQVRRAEERDIEAVAFVHVESWRSTYRGLVPDDVLDGLSVERRKPVWQQLISTQSRESCVLVLEDNDLVVGFCHCSRSRDGDAPPSTAEVNSIYLLASHWRRGGGSKLLNSGLEALKLAGFERATLWVLDTNFAAQRFYEGQGWCHDGHVKVEDRGSFQLREMRYARVI